MLDDIWFNYFWCHYDPQCEGAPAFPRRIMLGIWSPDLKKVGLLTMVALGCWGNEHSNPLSELIHPYIALHRWHRGGIQNEAAVSIPLTPSRRAHLCGSQPAESPQMCTELHGLHHQLVSQLTEHNWTIKQSNNRWIWNSWWTLKNKLPQVITTYISYRHDPGPPTAEWRPKGIASHRLDSHAVCIQQPTAGTRRDT